MLFHPKILNQSALRQKIRDFHRVNESTAIDHILPLAEVSNLLRSKAWERARTMVLRIREETKTHSGVDALLNEFSLSTAEGVVLMCLAEALLRIPDKQTQDELIRDKLSKGHWAPHLGNSDSLFVNASAWGLMLTGNVVSYTDERKQSQLGLLKKTMGRLGEPVIRKAMNIAMKVMGKQFVIGETIEDACSRATEKEQNGYLYSYDMLGEGARSQDDADRYFKSYEHAVHVIGKAAKGKGPQKSPGISVKLSAIHPKYDFKHHTTAVATITERLKELCLLAQQYDIGLTVDAEESERLDISLDIIENVFCDSALLRWAGFGIAVQAYQKRAIYVIEWLRELTTNAKKPMMVRLVKGAYWDTEIKHSQQGGYSEFPVFTRKSSTDVSYHACANRLLDYRSTIYPQFATHNAYTASIILELAGDNKTGFEFQCLHGMGDTLYDQIVREENTPCRIYAPVGQHEDLLAYLVRRLLENGANSSFVNAIVDESKPVEALLGDPVERTQRLNAIANPQIANPCDLFGDRINSKSIDLYDIQALVNTRLALEKWWQQHNAKAHVKNVVSPDMWVHNPANKSEVIGHLVFDDTASMRRKLLSAQQAFDTWSKTPVEERASLLLRIAAILERHMDELIGYCIKEAGKVPQDAIDEIREAVDFCRYYATEAQRITNEDTKAPRGVILCISPWNFPLAIFLGQVVAAVVTGNTVLAKPAEQTSLIAIRVMTLIESVGLPQNVIQLIIARGPDVGNALLPQKEIKGVIFTGSTTTGNLISNILSQRGIGQVPLIAETGGQNCMIVDSTALPEQVVDDIIHSGFQSAGQRCSALRVLYLQEDIADRIISMLVGAMRELNIGDPQWLSTDIGPVIDEKALTNLQHHVTWLQDEAKLIFKCDVSTTLDGHYFAPHLFEIDNIHQLPKEVFGPVVHVIRFKSNDIEAVMNDINSTGYGLTMGIHSRIEARVEMLAKLSKAGNVYINRNMIGAIVGVQPFGGRGLSGTGPKAGGPNYLSRLMAEKTRSSTRTANHGVEVEPISFVPTIEKAITDVNIVEAVNDIVDAAHRVEQPWRITSTMDRISWLRQFLARLADVNYVENIADNLNATLATARDQLFNVEQKLRNGIELPGPTGESNTLYYEPRGIMITFADKEVSFEYWFMSIVTALATGNVVIAVVSDRFYEQAKAVEQKLHDTGAPSDVFQVTALANLDILLSHDKVAGIVIDSNASMCANVAYKIASRKGAILPIITAEDYDNLIQRLLTEKTISIDTTASGGNTSLMTMEDDD